MHCFSDATEQANALLAAIQAQGLSPEACCVIARTHRELNDIQARLESRQQRCHRLDGRGVTTPDGALNLATMHRVKGLEFDAVFIASANQGPVPLEVVMHKAADTVTRRQRENEERALVYVSLTRARKLAFVYGYGEMSDWFGS